MAIDKTALPVYRKMYQKLCHIQKVINEKLRRLELLDAIEKAEGPQDWLSNVTATPKFNGKMRSCLHARTINIAIKRETFAIPILQCFKCNICLKSVFENRFERSIQTT